MTKVAFAVFKYLFLEFHVSKSNTKCTVLEASWVPPWEENLGKLCKYDVIYKIFLICTVLLVITRGDKFGKICKFYISDLHFDQCRGLSRTKYQTGEVWITCFFFIVLTRGTKTQNSLGSNFPRAKTFQTKRAKEFFTTSPKRA